MIKTEQRKGKEKVKKKKRTGNILIIYGTCQSSDVTKYVA